MNDKHIVVILYENSIFKNDILVFNVTAASHTAYTLLTAYSRIAVELCGELDMAVSYTHKINTLGVWQLATGECVHMLEGHLESVLRMTVHGHRYHLDN